MNEKRGCWCVSVRPSSSSFLSFFLFYLNGKVRRLLRFSRSPLLGEERRQSLDCLPWGPGGEGVFSFLFFLFAVFGCNVMLMD